MTKRSARLARLQMMTPISLLRVIIVLLAGVAVLALGGCRKPTTSLTPNTTPRSNPPIEQPAPRPADDQLGQQAVQTVADYLKALDDGKYTVAYELLSRESKEIHTISEFEQQGKQGMPSFDLKSAEATVTGNTALVSVQQLEDPASHGFHLVRENGAWKIVYRGGLPGAPLE